MTNSADPDQLASSDLHCLQKAGYIQNQQDQACLWLFLFLYSKNACQIISTGTWNLNLHHFSR